jgi:hypothetical protein
MIVAVTGNAISASGLFFLRPEFLAGGRPQVATGLRTPLIEYCLPVKWLFNHKLSVEPRSMFLPPYTLGHGAEVVRGLAPHLTRLFSALLGAPSGRMNLSHGSM